MVMNQSRRVRLTLFLAILAVVGCEDLPTTVVGTVPDAGVFEHGESGHGGSPVTLAVAFGLAFPFAFTGRLDGLPTRCVADPGARAVAHRPDTPADQPARRVAGGRAAAGQPHAVALAVGVHEPLAVALALRVRLARPLGDPATLAFVAPTMGTDFSREPVRIEVKATVAAGAEIAGIAAFYDGVLLKRQVSRDTSYILSSWNPNMVNSIDDQDKRPVAAGEHKLLVKLIAKDLREVTIEQTFIKPFRFFGWSTKVTHENEPVDLAGLAVQPISCGDGFRAIAALRDFWREVHEQRGHRKSRC